jgi:hypothetical protein
MVKAICIGFHPVQLRFGKSFNRSAMGLLGAVKKDSPLLLLAVRPASKPYFP